MQEHTPIDNGDASARATSSALKKLLFFSLLIIVAPISCYFCSKSFIFEWTLGMTSLNSYFYAAIVSIVVLHIVLAMFVYVAWSDNLKVSTYKTD
ncbi:Vacuolar ATPase assembly integral membrane protein VMA21 [Lamellibrachia satsuma]|nr:Vacuolar ATPase assembly integral membrane protein VMA21 [Lamellibrachia satsuma]